MRQELEVFLRPGVAGEHDFTRVRRRKVDIEHLNGCKLFQRLRERQPLAHRFNRALSVTSRQYDENEMKMCAWMRSSS